MSTATLTPPRVVPATTSVPSAPPADPHGFHSPVQFRRLTVDEYRRMMDADILLSGDPVELLRGQLVMKMSRNPPHDFAITVLNRWLMMMLPANWLLRCQSATTLPDEDEPEPDFALVRGTERDYAARHPGPADTGVAIEVADSSLARDRFDKGPIYAEAGIPVYWVVNVVDRQVEVYTDPDPAADTGYRTVRLFGPAEVVPLVLDGTTVGSVPVAEVLA